MPQHLCRGGQTTLCRWFSCVAVFVWVPAIKFRSPDMCSSAFHPSSDPPWPPLFYKEPKGLLSYYFLTFFKSLKSQLFNVWGGSCWPLLLIKAVKTGLMMHTYSLSTPEAEGGITQVQGKHRLHSKACFVFSSWWHILPTSWLHAFLPSLCVSP